MIGDFKRYIFFKRIYYKIFLDGYFEKIHLKEFI